MGRNWRIANQLGRLLCLLSSQVLLFSVAVVQAYDATVEKCEFEVTGDDSLFPPTRCINSLPSRIGPPQKEKGIFPKSHECGVGPAEKTVSVGFIATLSGPRASMGEDALLGAELALDDIKQQYPNDPARLELVIEDSQGDPLSAVRAYRKLKAQGIKLVLTQNSNVSLPISLLVNSDQVVQLAFNTTVDAFSQAHDLTFRINGTTRDEAELMANALGDCLARNPGLLAMVIMEDEYPRTLAANLTDILAQRGIQPLLTESFVPGESDFRSVISRLKQRHISCVALLSYQSEAGLFVKQQSQLHLSPQLIIANAPVNNVEFFTIAGAAASGVLVTYQRVDERHAAAVKFKARHGKNVNWFSANGYDAVTIAYHALRLCGFHAGPQCLKTEIPKIGAYQGLGGKKHFDQVYGDMLDEYLILEAREGEFYSR